MILNHLKWNKSEHLKDSAWLSSCTSLIGVEILGEMYAEEEEDFKEMKNEIRKRKNGF